jgi:hypothetical protein
MKSQLGRACVPITFFTSIAGIDRLAQVTAAATTENSMIEDVFQKVEGAETREELERPADFWKEKRSSLILLTKWDFETMQCWTPLPANVDGRT